MGGSSPSLKESMTETVTKLPIFHTSMYTASCYYLQDIESGSDVKAGDKMTLLNAKPGSSSLEVTVSFSMFMYFHSVELFICHQPIEVLLDNHQWLSWSSLHDLVCGVCRELASEAKAGQ